MPWSASVLYAPVGALEAWRQHPALGPALHHFEELERCHLPEGGLLAVPDVLPPEDCQIEAHLPWDALFAHHATQLPRKLTRQDPPAALLGGLAALNTPLVFYRGETHGGDFHYELAWLFGAEGIQRLRAVGRRVERWRAGAGETVAGDVLKMALEHLGCRLDGGWFAPHTSSFDWNARRLNVQGAIVGSAYRALQRKDYGEARRLVESGRPFAKGLLGLAAALDHLEMVDLLLAHEAVPDSDDLARALSAEVAGRLLRAGARPEERVALNMLREGGLAAYRALGGGPWASVEERLFAACLGGVVEIVAECLDEEPALLHLIRFGQNPLLVACSQGRAAVAELLIERGAGYDEACLVQASAAGSLTLVGQILQAGVSPRSRQFGRPALVEAARNNRVEVMQRLFQAGGLPDEPDDGGATPLHAAALHGAQEAAEWLLRQNVNIDARSRNNSTPLRCAVASGCQPLVNRLREQGACIDAETVDFARGRGIEL